MATAIPLHRIYAELSPIEQLQIANEVERRASEAAMLVGSQGIQEVRDRVFQELLEPYTSRNLLRDRLEELGRRLETDPGENLPSCSLVRNREIARGQ